MHGLSDFGRIFEHLGTAHLLPRVHEDVNCPGATYQTVIVLTKLVNYLYDFRTQRIIKIYSHASQHPSA